uniref:glycosyltransferase family 2 protein n=1 Tax=Rhodosalinus sediminis TaxID=1940533 RepID=UPI00235669E2
MRIVLHVGLDPWAVERLRRVMAAKRRGLARRGILLPKSPGANNHTRLFMAVSDPDRVDLLRAQRGFAPAEAQARLREELAAGLAEEVAAAEPEVLVLSAWQLGQQLVRRAELARLRALLAPLSERIEVVAHVAAPARMLARHYAMQVLDGRARPLSQELSLPGDGWWEAACAAAPAPDPGRAIFPEVQGPPHWLDLARFEAEWEAVFGPLRLRTVEPAALSGAGAMAEVAATLGLSRLTGKAEPETPPAPPAAAWLARARAMNALFLRYIAAKDAVIPRRLWRRLLAEVAVEGPGIDPGALGPVSERLGPGTAAVAAAHGLDLAPPPEAAPWTEADPGPGFRATHYLLAFRPRIDRATKEARRAAAPPEADAPHLPPAARAKLAQLLGSPFAPHDRLGHVKEDAPGPPHPPARPRARPEDGTGRVIVACMKNEAPYIVEWVAYHRAIGVDDFLIYTNDCEDGTDALLARLDALGVVRHRTNDAWQGNSPQQHALDRARAEPVVRDAAWLMHIDVDEFVNVRCGDGTLDAFLARGPEATNVAMTWRLFGRSGVARLEDRVVIEQVTRRASAPSRTRSGASRRCSATSAPAGGCPATGPTSARPGSRTACAGSTVRARTSRRRSRRAAGAARSAAWATTSCSSTTTRCARPRASSSSASA